MRLAVDLDGVVCDFDSGWRKQYQLWFGGPVLPLTGNWNSVVEQTHFPSKNQFWKWVDSNPRFWRDMDVIPGAWGALFDLRSAGHQIVFVTNRHGKARVDTTAWIINNFGYYDWDLEHIEGDKCAVEWDVLVEDNPKNIQAAVNAGRPVIRFVQPWNRGSNGIPARSWGEVRYIIDSMAEALKEVEAA